MKTQTFLAAGLLSLALTAPAFAEGQATHADERAESTAEKTGEFLSDSALTAKVKTALIAEKDLKSMAINVESNDGVVTLSGELPTAASIVKAETAAKGVKGVKEVHNNLTIKKS